MGPPDTDDEDLRALEDLLGPRRPRKATTADPAQATPSEEAVDAGDVRQPSASRGAARPEGAAEAPEAPAAEAPEAPAGQAPPHGSTPDAPGGADTAQDSASVAAAGSLAGKDFAASDSEGSASPASDAQKRDASGADPSPPAAAPPAPPGSLAREPRGGPDRQGDVLDAETVPEGHIVALTPLDPAIGLAQRLRQDRLVTVPARPWPRIAALAAAGLSLLLWVFALRASALGRPWPGPGMPATITWFLLAAAALGALPVMARAWPTREMHLPLASTQQEQLVRVEAQARAMRLLIAGGLLGAIGGLAVLALAFRFAPVQDWTLPVGLGSLVLAGGTVAAIVGVARWLPVRMLYVQTLVLQRLESLGLGRQLGMDPRTAEVLAALDGLLGELPESAVREFLSRPEAEWYLELIAKIRGDQRGR